MPIFSPKFDVKYAAKFENRLKNRNFISKNIFEQGILFEYGKMASWESHYFPGKF